MATDPASEGSAAEPAEEMSAGDPPLPEGARRTDLFPVFSFFYAVAIFAHQWKVADIVSLDFQVVLSVATIWTMLRPSSLKRFLIMVVCQVISALIVAPYITNHWTLMTLGSLSILLCVVITRAKQEQSGITAAELYDCMAAPLRLMLLLLYFWSTVAKFNESFFDPSVSCAVEMARWLHNKLPFMPLGDWTHSFYIWGVLLTEGALPLLLISRRTRAATIVIGWVFHLSLAINLFFAFSATVMAFYVLFLPDDFGERFREATKRSPRFSRLGGLVHAFARHKATFPVLALLLVVAGLSTLVFGEPRPPLNRTVTRVGQLLWMAGSGSAVAAFVFILWPQGGGVATRFVAGIGNYAGLGLRCRYALCYVGPLVVLFNGTSPYLGLKTENSFAMFSNLRTEGDYWNHSFIPRAVRWFPFQDDLVVVDSSSDNVLSGYAMNGTRMVHWDFVRHMNGVPDATVSYTYRGRRYDVARARDDAILSDPVNPLLKKFLWFRRVLPRENNHCSH